MIYAQRSRHRTVLRRGAHQRAPARTREQQVQQREYDWAHHDQKQVVARELTPENRHCACEAGCSGPEQIFRAPQPKREVFNDEHQRKSCQQLKQFRRAVNAPQHHHFNQRADQPHHQCGEWQGEPKSGPRTDARIQPLGQRVGDVQAQHEKRSVRKINDARDAKNQ